ncbi:MAG: hypothetical protein AAF327_11950 [Cyanobacteria bacterium P01_A01_bin.37]
MDVMLWAIARCFQEFSVVPNHVSWRVVANPPQSFLFFRSPQHAISEWKMAIAAKADSWFQDHPILAWLLDYPMAWLLNHPLISLVVVGVALLFFLSFLQLMVEMARKLWLVLLQLPLLLLRWAMGQIYVLTRAGLQRAGLSFLPLVSVSPKQSSVEELRSYELLRVQSTLPRDSDSALANKDIAQLLYRLEQLTHEQTQILHEIAQLTEAKS